MINGEAYLNMKMPVWNGTFFSNVTQQPDDAMSNVDASWFDNASNGV
jgi:hypothetical protein